MTSSGRRASGVRRARRWRASVALAAAIATVALNAVTITTASATPYTSLISWGLNDYGQVGDGSSSGPQLCHGLPCATTPGAVTGLTPGLVKAFATGDSFELALLQNGTVLSWGENDYGGELGDGTASGPQTCTAGPCSTAPVAVCAVGQSSCTPTSGELTNVAAISAADYNSLALLTNGTVVAWGVNELGELGDGSAVGPDSACGGETPCALTPVTVCAVGRSSCTPTSGELTGVRAISSGNGASVALLTNGTLVTWGWSVLLGDGTTTGPHCSGDCTPSPVAVCAVGGCGHGVLRGVVAVQAADGWFLALLSTGKVVAWGDPSNGELGIGPHSGHYVTAPTYVCAVGGCSHGDLTDVKAIAGDDDFSLALLRNGTVRAWGENNFGQLGDGTTTEADVPVAVCAVGRSRCTSTEGELTGVAAIASGEAGVALLTSGAVRAWGENVSGELGDGTSTGPRSCVVAHLGCATVPVAVPGLAHIVAISAGEFNVMAAI